MPDGAPAHLLAALQPLLDRVGGTVVEGPPGIADVPVPWEGEAVLHVRLPESASGPQLPEGSAGGPAERPAGGPAAAPGSAAVVASEGTDLSDGLARLIAEVETELGGSLADLPRAQKQHAVRLLEERGAFEMRRSAETVAEALGLTRFTVYNYLNRIRETDASRG
jgi:hypothetical protein